MVFGVAMGNVDFPFRRVTWMEESVANLEETLGPPLNQNLCQS
jgi:hypothetical protein